MHMQLHRIAALAVCAILVSACAAAAPVSTAMPMPTMTSAAQSFTVSTPVMIAASPTPPAAPQASAAPIATETAAPAITIEPTAGATVAAQPTPHGRVLSDVVNADYRAAFAFYTTMNRPADDVTLTLGEPPRALDTIRDMYLSQDAIAAQRAGQPLPVGSIVVMEVYRAQTGTDGQSLRDENGRFVRGELLAVETARNERADNEVWSVGVFDPQTLNAKPFDVQKCLTCHDTAANGHPFIMTNRGLRTFVSSGNAAFGVCSRPDRESC
jgi:hypothetical protein